jgi:hypothetical protein
VKKAHFLDEGEKSIKKLLEKNSNKKINRTDNKNVPSKKVAVIDPNIIQVLLVILTLVEVLLLTSF